MNEPFILELRYGKQDYAFPVAFQRYGYTYRIAVSIADEPFVFEQDEEGGYRVLGTPAGGRPDTGLLQAIAEKLSKLGAA